MENQFKESQATLAGSRGENSHYLQRFFPFHLTHSKAY